ncbi:hypothetical protein [Bradyrhizobium sp. SZCCHNR1051]|uniref:hypothetical protein n=1 Tax=Bradyrhizobium sp. SZCCHNR1051 TaxID=3057355 RepID=UPI0029162B50|nr:hypothetical protein [Bradyrhizobium sp. SZCCHNR1051]
MNGAVEYARLSVFCPKCTTTVTWPPSLSATDKARIAAEIRRSQIEGHKLLVAQFGFSMREAKALTLHVTLTEGTCHRCRRPLSQKDDVSVCETCRSANLDW